MPRSAITCSECGVKYTVSSECSDNLSFCPFCGDEALMPFDDVDDDEILEEEFDELDGYEDYE